MSADSETNRAALVAALNVRPMTLAELAAATRMPARTASNLLRALALSGDVHRIDAPISQLRGKAPRTWSLGPPPEDLDAADDGEARDIEASRAWVKRWKPCRDSLVCSMFPPVAQRQELASQMAAP